MSKKMDLNLPKRRALDKSAFGISPRHLSAWINSLPRANLGETAKQLYNLLRQTNGINYPYQKRLQFLEALREPVAYVTDSMKKHFIGISLPLPDKNQKIANITKKLFSYMATGYKIALEDAIANKSLFFNKAPLALLVHRSMSYMGKNILTSYQSYSQFSNQHWKELHQLYAFAEQQNIHQDNVQDSQHLYTEESSVMDEYTKILLLSLASPSHLQHGESGKVYGALEHWLTQPLIRPLSTSDKVSDQFVTNLAQASAPASLSFTLAEGIRDKSTLRVIDTTVLSEKVEHEIQKRENSNTKGININNTYLSLDLLQRLLIAWDIKTKRHSRRVDKNEEIKITIGLSATHQLISQKNQTTSHQKYANKYNNRSQYAAVDVAHKLSVPDEDVWALNYTPEKKEDTEEESDNNNTEIEMKLYQTDDWLIVNESLKGLSINNRDELNNKVQVGELVSIYRKVDGQAKKWNIGVIRWIRFNADESLQMGIEVLNPNSAAVGICKKGVPLQRALMLPSQQKQPACLITPPTIWKKGDKITINMQGKEVSAIFTKPIQNTSLFSQYQFEITSENFPQQNEQNLTNKKLTDSDIWSLI